MFLLLCFCLYDHFPAISPWCKRWGRSCELHLQGHVQPLDPGSSSAQTPHGHSNNAPRRLLHLCTPAVHLCQCGAYGQEGGGEIGKHREVRHYCPSLIIPRDLPWITWSNYIMKYVQVMWQHTWLSLCSLFCGHCSVGPSRSDPLPMDPRSHPPSLSDMSMAPWMSRQLGHPSQSTQWSTSILELEQTNERPHVKWVALVILNMWSVFHLQLDTHQDDWIWGAETRFHWKQALREHVHINF